MKDLIDSIVDLVSRNKLRGFIISLVIVLITGGLMRFSSSCLVSATTPRAIIDLELAFNSASARDIRGQWKEQLCSSALFHGNTSLEAAYENIAFDFPFIAAYTTFFVIVLIIVSSRLPVTIFIIMAMAAGILDVIENCFMFAYLSDAKISSYMFAVPASLKFLLLGFLLMVILFRLTVRFLHTLKMIK